ncbi:MAG TPA: LuxR family transcriptional regulator [Rhodanobacteraceae bacterium]|jgi:DNA-binding CsgD family transcriptional regulator|nr:LuxR family transcriptional regulator [Rhodanobacteraceae bacterium]
MRAHLDTLEALLACTTPDELRRAVGEFAKRLGFDSWVYAANPNGQHAFPYVLSAYPTAWLERYIERGYLTIDPVVSHCRDHATPLVWTADGPLNDRTRRCPAFFHDAADFGLKVGVSTPVHGLGCQWGLLSLAGSDTRTDRRTKLEQVAGAQLLATFTHEVGHRFATSQSPTNVHLTARELECLRWAAEGKTGWEIGRLLGISERTVVFHVENAARKLGVFGRRQAVARAIALQLITL